MEPQEVKPKKNLDYSASAVNLTNPPEVAVLMAQFADCQAVESDLKKKADMCVPQELKDALKMVYADIVNMGLNVKEAVDKYGSYQNLETGQYALKQRKVSKSYDAFAFKQSYTKYAPAVIEESVNVKALEGLIRGKLITEEGLRISEVIKETESFTYIIK